MTTKPTSSAVFASPGSTSGGRLQREGAPDLQSILHQQYSALGGARSVGEEESSICRS